MFTFAYVQGPAEEDGFHEGEQHAPEGETLAVDRAIACHLLQIVYDASPLVRAEVALSLSRLVSGHNVLFQVSFGQACMLKALLPRIFCTSSKIGLLAA